MSLSPRVSSIKTNQLNKGLLISFIFSDKRGSTARPSPLSSPRSCLLSSLCSRPLRVGALAFLLARHRGRADSSRLAQARSPRCHCGPLAGAAVLPTFPRWQFCWCLVLTTDPSGGSAGSVWVQHLVLGARFHSAWSEKGRALTWVRRLGALRVPCSGDGPQVEQCGLHSCGGNVLQTSVGTTGPQCGATPRVCGVLWRGLSVAMRGLGLGPHTGVQLSLYGWPRWVCEAGSAGSITAVSGVSPVPVVLGATS